MREAPEAVQREKQGKVCCSRCGEEREASEYMTETLRTLKEAEKLQDAVCLHCDPVHLPPKWESKRFRCKVCLDDLGFEKFSLAW